MALHGTIRVDGLVIGYWGARRKEHPPEAVNTYEVECEFSDINGVHHHKKGEITHEFGDGALVLASEVLRWAGENISPAKESPENAKTREP